MVESRNLHRPRDIRMPGPGLRPAVPATESFRRSLMEFPIASKWIGRRGRAPARRVAMAMRRKRPTIFLEKANWEARRSGGRKRTASEGGGSQNVRRIRRCKVCSETIILRLLSGNPSPTAVIHRYLIPEGAVPFCNRLTS